MTSALLIPACATCISQDGQVTTLAANGAVYIMFGALTLVFGCFAAAILTIARRNRKHAQSVTDGESLRA